jgi:hypothetical protein
MLEHLKPLTDALAPVVAELAVALIGIILATALASVRRYFGLKAEALMREALNKAILTGVKQAKGGTLDAITAQAVEYAKKSSPGAIKGLKARPDVLVDKARAAANELMRGGG